MKNLSRPNFLSLSFSTLIARITLAFAFACTFTVQVDAQVAPKISIQGTLKSANGTTVADGAYAVTFKLYDAATGGNVLWQEDTTVEVVGGIYSHYLGSVTPLDAADFANPVFLGVRVGSYELTPRSELSYAPYAFSVAAAQTVVCSGAVGDVKYSILNPTQFAAVNGSCWVPMDGRTMVATDKLRIITGLTAVPNGGGLFLRSQEFSGGADNDPGRTSASTIATLQTDDNKSHNHTMQTSGSHTHTVTLGWDGDDSGDGGASDEWTHNGSRNFDITLKGGTVSTNGAHTHTIDNSGGTEARPKNLNFWIYIRIN